MEMARKPSDTRLLRSYLVAVPGVSMVVTPPDRWPAET